MSELQSTGVNTRSRTAMPDAAMLVADIGGTHIRLGLASPHRDDTDPRLMASSLCRGADFAKLEDAVGDFLRQHVDVRIESAVFACAGYIDYGGRVFNNNLPWEVSAHQLRQYLRLPNVAVINDFIAAGYATDRLPPEAISTLLAGARGRRQHREVESVELIIGPGTGLGSALILRRQPHPIILASEAGQTTLAPHDAHEAAILHKLSQRFGRVTYEHALSGPGIVNVYRAICELADRPATFTTPEAISESAQRTDGIPEAHEAMSVFCSLLGSFAGDMALLHGAVGGVWLAGGILPKIRPLLQRSAFGKCFLEKGDMRPIVESTPVMLIDEPHLGLIGAAAWGLINQSSMALEAEKSISPLSGDCGVPA